MFHEVVGSRFKLDSGKMDATFTEDAKL
jgi:hypothetical protein